MIAIHNSGQWSFRPEWVSYCENNNVAYKLVNAYDSNIIDQLKDCTAFMFHFHHTIIKDYLFAQQLLFSLQQKGLKVFPDFNTAWHFDDKLGQKYLLESIGARIPKTSVFYERKDALTFIEETKFPLVFKLRGGAGSNNVALLKTKEEAITFINKAFNKGFSNYNKRGDLKDEWKRWKQKKSSNIDLLKSIRRLVFSTKFAKMVGNESGYFMVQEFVPENKADIRVVTIGDKAFAIKRLVRDNDFRASGSGKIIYDKSEIPQSCVDYAFEISKKLGTQCCAYDFVFDHQNQPIIVEINYGFAHRSYNDCPGYYLQSGEFIEKSIDPCGWMVELVRK
jgi:glutathione synthase/RimK-type ligase-like ATP-grasp enzyme